MEVYKFGGASVKDAEAVRNVAQILQKEEGPKVLVFSAMGKTTNALEAVLDAFYNNEDNKSKLFKELMVKHLEMIGELFQDDLKSRNKAMEYLKTSMDNLYQLLLECAALPYDMAYDGIVSYGERLSTMLISLYLNANGIENEEIDARNLIRTDSTYREGNVLWAQTAELVDKQILPVLEQGKWIVTQGFIAGDEKGRTITLGREGSDYSAAILSHCLGVKQMTIWKDVPGVLNADPKFFEHTQKLDYISYNDATELAYFGASVIHPKTIKPLQNKQIPLYVRSFLHPQEIGTWVGLNDVECAQIPSYIFKRNQVLLSIYPKDFSFIEEYKLIWIFECLTKFSAKINMMQNSALSFSLCIDIRNGKIKELISDLETKYDCLYNEGVDLITIRHYTQDVIDKIVSNSSVLLEQRTRRDVQLVVTTL